MTHFDYIFQYLLPSWVETINVNFRRWRDLITSNYEPYTIKVTDDPFQECRDWFWLGINEDFTLEKDYIEYLDHISEQFLKNLDEQGHEQL
jgi:hypothetical protein